MGSKDFGLGRRGLRVEGVGSRDCGFWGDGGVQGLECGFKGLSIGGGGVRVVRGILGCGGSWGG